MSLLVTSDPPETIVVRVLEDAWFSSRVIEDRKINPHGEESEYVFMIEEEMIEGCAPVYRYAQ